MANRSLIKITKLNSVLKVCHTSLLLWKANYKTALWSIPDASVFNCSPTVDVCEQWDSCSWWLVSSQCRDGKEHGFCLITVDNIVLWAECNRHNSRRSMFQYLFPRWVFLSSLSGSPCAWCKASQC